MISIAGLIAVMVLAFLRLPIAFAMGVVGAVGMAYMTSMSASISVVGRLMIDTSQDYGLSVVPLFVLMGQFVNKGGLSRELYRAAFVFLGHLRGGLAMTTIVACAGFSAICGSSVATAATMAKVAMPEMRRLGYNDALSTASIAAGGTLGILIPPSVILVIYGLMTQTSIAKLFLAGIIPGLLGVLFYLFAVQFSVMRDPSAGPSGPRSTWPERLRALRDVWSVVLLFFIVIGGLYGAFDFAPLNITFSPTEAAGIGAMGAFLIALFRGQLNARVIGVILIDTAATTAALFSVLIGAWMFSNFVNLAGLPADLQTFVLSFGAGPMTVMLVIVAVYLLLGCVFESMSMLLLTVPIFFPLVSALGIDPVWFGIVVVVVTEISLITPPVGLNVFVLKGVVSDVSTGTIFRGVTPFWVADLFRLALLMAFSGISLYLPNMMN